MDIDGASPYNAVMRTMHSFVCYKAFERLGNKGWNWKTLKKYYHKVERFILPEVKDDAMRFDAREHGFGGMSCPIYI
jgi:hypothetical protein